jgi:hypothetical protein
MNLNNRLKNFPHIYYVNLDNRNDRREYMEEQFEYWKLPCTRVSGSKYLASNLNEWGRDKVVGKVNGIPAYALGNAVTHLEFMKHWIQTRDDDHLLLMEDDYDLNLFQYWNFDWDYLMSRLPYDWDCIQLGFESSEFIPFFLHPKLRHSYFGPVLMTRDYVEKILSLHCYKDKYRFDKVTAIESFSKHSTTVDYFIAHTGRTYCIPLITTNVGLTSTEFNLKINRIHHTKSRNAYYEWWIKRHLKFSLDDFFTYGKAKDTKMTILIGG